MDFNDFLRQFDFDFDPKFSCSTYRYKDHFIDIVLDCDNFVYEAWLYDKSCCVKFFIHRCSMKEVPYTDFLFSVISGIDQDIEFYDEHYNF